VEQVLERRLHEALVELSPEDIHAVVAFAQFLRDRHQGKERGMVDAELSAVERVQILSEIDAGAALSAETGPPVCNRDHDRCLYDGKVMAVYVDTGTWFAYFVRRDSDHEAAVRWMRQNREPLVTADYILDELLLLLKVRERYCLALAAGERLWQQRVARVTRGMCGLAGLQRRRLDRLSTLF